MYDTKEAKPGLARRICALLLGLLLAGSCLPAWAAPEAKNVPLRVGYMDYHGFIDLQPDGTYAGYGVEYLDRISQYTGFTYEYVFGTWSELLVMLENREIDLLCTAQRTEERADLFDYSAYPVGYTQGLLYTRKNNAELHYEEFAAFDGMTVGAIGNNAMSAIFAGYARQHGFSYEQREYATEDQLMAALNEGAIDAICSEHLANHTELSLLANFGADAYYLISYKNNPFMSRINFALQEIKTDVDFEADLYHKYYDNSAAASAIPFTLEESEYIAASPPVVVGLMTDRSPLADVDENGKASGMIVELMDLISQASGLRFTYRFLDVGQTGFDFLTKADGDLVAGVAVSAFSTPNPALIQSDTLQKTSVVFVGRDGMEFSVNASLTVALPAGFIGGETVVSAEYPHFRFFHGTTNDDCLAAIRDGKADVMLQNLYIIRECLQSPLYEGLEMFPAYSFDEEQKILALPENAPLISIINKAMAAITEEQANDVVINNTIAKGYHPSTSELLYKYRLPLIGIVVLLATVIILLIGFSIARQRNVLAMEAVNNQLKTANAQLGEAVIQADRANTAKSRFLSQISHEIRTPMNAIVGLTEIARQYKTEPERIDDCLGKIAVSSKLLLNIINDVLDMSAIESNKLKIAHEEFDIKQILESIRTIYYPQCQNKGIRFHMVTDVKNEHLKGDSLRVGQIMLNLVSNAYKFTEAGGEIRIRVQQTAQRGETVFLRFSISDTGSGMTDDMKERLFKPFEQEQTSTARRYGGSGLGLSIVKNLVDMMHGAISVESEKGKGTTFVVDLPFEKVGGVADASDPILGSLRVLAVDDDEIAREYTATVLKRIGAPFSMAGSGKEALDMIRQARDSGKPYDVCLIDWKMPDMDGVEITRRIRREEKTRTMIIIVSAYDFNEVQDEAMEAGADQFVSKPLFQSTVFDALMTQTRGDLGKKNVGKEKCDFTGRKVLLAEDQELNAEIAIELLDQAHMAADRAANGREAVERFAASTPGTYDAILMDVQMPEMDGYEATMAIRALDRPDAKTVPIFAMTANAFTEDVSAALSAGMNGHIAKPIDTKLLYATLAKAMDQTTKGTKKNG